MRSNSKERGKWNENDLDINWGFCSLTHWNKTIASYCYFTLILVDKIVLSRSIDLFFAVSSEVNYYKNCRKLNYVFQNCLEIGYTTWLNSNEILLVLLPIENCISHGFYFSAWLNFLRNQRRPHLPWDNQCLRELRRITRFLRRRLGTEQTWPLHIFLVTRVYLEFLRIKFYFKRLFLL